MSYELSGKLIHIEDTVQVSENFRKREFVVEKEEHAGDRTFTDTIKFQVVQDRCNLLDNMQLNDAVKITFNIRGRKWERDGKVNYFNNLEAWRIEKPVAEGVDMPPMPDMADIPPENGESDDLPF